MSICNSAGASRNGREKWFMTQGKKNRLEKKIFALRDDPVLAVEARIKDLL